MKFPTLFLRKTQFTKTSYAKNGCFLADMEVNILGDELLLNFDALNYNLTCKITKLPWQPSVHLSAKMATKF